MCISWDMNVFLELKCFQFVSPDVLLQKNYVCDIMEYNCNSMDM